MTRKHRFGALAAGALALLVPASGTMAQGGSMYSTFGLGDLRRPGAVYDGLGGTATAFPSDHGINFVNPAMWSANKSTRLQVGYRFSQASISSENASLAQNFGELDGIDALFAVDTGRGIAVGFGLNPFSSVNYAIGGTNVQSTGGSTFEFRRNAVGSGGVSTLFLGASWSPIPEVSIGAAYHHYFGNISDADSSTLVTGSFYISSLERKSELRGGGYRLGVSVMPAQNLRVAASMAGFSALEITSNDFFRSYDAAGNQSEIRSDAGTRTVEVPVELNLGVSYASGKFVVGADYSRQDFTGFNYRVLQTVGTRPRQRFSAGAIRIGNRSAGAPTLDRIGYTAGLAYEQLPWQVGSTGIDEMSASAGLQIPIVGSMLDLAFTGGQRGSKGAGTVSELFFRFSANLSIGESWFHPFRRE